MSDRSPSSEPAPHDRIPAAHFLLLTLLSAAVLGVQSMLAQRRGSQFYADDFLFLQLAHNNDLSLDWLTTDNYGHLAPLTRLAYFATDRALGLDYAWAAAVPAALVVTLFLTLCWLFRELLGRRYLVLGLALLGTASVPVVRTMLWWGAAVHVLGAAAMMTLCVTAFVVWSRRGSEVYRVVSVMALVAGLLVQERPLLTVGYLVLIRYLWGLGWRSGRPMRQMLREEALVWLPYAAVSLAYLIYRVFLFPSSPQPGDLGQSVEFVALSTIRGWAPTLVGSRVLPGTPLTSSAALIGLAAFAVLTVVLIRKRQGAWRALAFLALVYLANLGIVAVGRLNVADLGALATDLQYYVDVHIATLIAFVLGFTLLPAREGRPTRRAASPAARYAVPLVALALVVSTAATARAIVNGNAATVAHGYVNTAQTGLREHPGPYALMRTKMPITVVPAFNDPYTDVPAIFALDDSIETKLDPAAPTRLVVLADGSVVDAHGETEVSIPITSNRVRADLGTLEFRDGSACLSGEAGAYFLLQLPEQVTGTGHYVGISYTSSDDAQIQISTRADATAYNWSRTDLPAVEDQTVVDRLEGTQIRKLVLAATTSVQDLCVSRVVIGRLAAEVDGECQIISEYGDPLEPAAVCDQEWPGPARDD